MAGIASAQLPEFKITNPWKDFLGVVASKPFILTWSGGAGGEIAIQLVYVHTDADKVIVKEIRGEIWCIFTDVYLHQSIDKVY